MAWIELHQTLPTHRKTMKLRRILKIKTPQTVGHVAMLWLWSLDNAPDGDLSQVDVEDIAEAAEWPKTAEEFVSALKEAGFIDDNMQLHDWGEYAGRLMDQREERRKKERDRKAEYRAKKRMEGADNRDSPVNVPRDSPTQDGTVPLLPNLTVPYQTKQDPCPPPDAPAGAGGGGIADGDAALKNEALLAAESVGEPEPAPRVDPGLGKVMSFYMNRINTAPSQISVEELTAFAKDFDPDVIIKAMEYAIDEHKATWSYIKATLQAYKAKGIHTLADWQRANDEYERAKQRRKKDAHNASTCRNTQGRDRDGTPPADADPLRGFYTEP